MDKSEINIQRAGELFMHSVWLQGQMSDLIILKKNPEYIEDFVNNPSGIRPKYLSLEEIWKDIPNIYDLAKSICPDDNKFFYLHPAQLVKHILGLKKEFRKEGFRLLYLWYDVLGEEGAVHRKEIEAFSEVTRSDGVKFHALSYQELIVKLSNEYRSEHGKYIKYISSRYL